eukprot:34003-Eustigmatos_ZCMA.PRE.1
MECTGPKTAARSCCAILKASCTLAPCQKEEDRLWNGGHGIAGHRDTSCNETRGRRQVKMRKCATWRL